MHYIYSQSLVVGSLIKAWDSFLLEPRNSLLSCSDLLVTARQACTSKGIPLPTFSFDTKGELDEIILCSAEVIVANLNHIKLNTCSSTLNNIATVSIELDKPGLEIMADGLRLLRRDMEGMRSHYLSKIWLEQNKLSEAYEHVDLLLSFIDQTLHGNADALSYHSLLERYKLSHQHDHEGNAHINFYAIDEKISDNTSKNQELNALDPNLGTSVFVNGQQVHIANDDKVFAKVDEDSYQDSDKRLGAKPLGLPSGIAPCGCKFILNS